MTAQYLGSKMYRLYFENKEIIISEEFISKIKDCDYFDGLKPIKPNMKESEFKLLSSDKNL